MSTKIGWGSYNVYNFLKDKVVWHDLTRNKDDLPEISPTLVILLESETFQGLGRYREGYHACLGGYKYFEKEEKDYGGVGKIKRWAYIPKEVWVLYHEGFFNTCDNLQVSFKDKSEFEYYAKQAVREKVPANADFVGNFKEDTPCGFYNASIYWSDGKYYLADGCKNWDLD